MPPLADQVNDALWRSGRCAVVVSEGVAADDVGASRDLYGVTVHELAT